MEFLDEVMQEIVKYPLLDADERKKIDDFNRNYWFKVSAELDKLCTNNIEYIQLEEKIADIEQRIRFDFNSAFVEEIILARGYEDSWYQAPYKLRKDSYEYHIDIAQHAREINAEIENEIKRLENATFVINRKKRIARLKGDIEYNKKFQKIYNDLLPLKQKQEYYEQNKKTLLDPLKDRRNNILLGYAKEVIAKALKDNPSLICNEQSKNTIITPLNSNESYILFNTFNDIREKMIGKTKEVINERKHR